MQHVSCSPGTLVSSTNKTDHHDIAEILLLKVMLNTIILTLKFLYRVEKFVAIMRYRKITRPFCRSWLMALYPMSLDQYSSTFTILLGMWTCILIDVLFWAIFLANNIVSVLVSRGRSWVWALMGSNQRLWKWYSLHLR